jgi:3,4-dihydroxy 2-butanone 4-phosphate synthase/GTP cyclohydrolase II
MQRLISNKAYRIAFHITKANNDILNSLTAAMDKKMDNVFNRIIQEGKGAVLFINQEVDSSDLLHRLKELKHLQSQGNNRVPQIKMDVKDFGIGAQILHDIDISRIRLISNTTQSKRVGMIGYGLEIMEYVVY